MGRHGELVAALETVPGRAGMGGRRRMCHARPDTMQVRLQAERRAAEKAQEEEFRRKMMERLAGGWFNFACIAHASGAT